jgi:SOS-response transcriptional repressor LexA
MGKARTKIYELHSAKLTPWDKSEFGTLAGQLDQGIAAIKYLEMSHHAGGTGRLTMAEATNVEVHWRDKLEPALRRAFNLARDHFVIHGGLRALHATEPGRALPEGYTDKVKAFRLKILGRAAALTGGRVADGRLDVNFSATNKHLIVLGRHFAFRLCAPTLEPVARQGDILLVRDKGEPTPKSLVVARFEDRVVARRFEIAENHSDIAVLTAHAINPRQIVQPIVVKKSTLKLHQIIGVLFDQGRTFRGVDGEVNDCGGESVLNNYVTKVKGLVEVEGHSAEPVALDGQMLLVGDPVSAHDALGQFEGQPVIASDGDDNRYFKRLRRGDAKTVVLESLEISGDLPPVLLTHQTGQTRDLKEVWPVYGVLFERS